MKLRIDIHMDNAAFFNEEGEFKPDEVVRILEVFSNRIKRFQTVAFQDIFDINGNRVGSSTVED